MNNELKHYGVPGMRWGKRKGRVVSEDSARVSKIRKKKIREMSNQELETVNKRLNLENNYKNLKRRPNRGKQAVEIFIKTPGKIAAVAGAYAVYKTAASGAIKKIGNWVIKDIKPIG